MNEKEFEELKKIPWHDERLWLGTEFEKELYKEYYKQLKNGDTNMGFDEWKLSNEVLNND